MPFRHVVLILAVAGVAVFIMEPGNADTSDREAKLTATPPQFHGPFYPSALPRDTDNDLLFINESAEAAQGDVVHLSGRIVDLDGTPVANAVVELWQSDAKGVYVHHDSPNRSEYDRNFQGFGRVLTNASGEYYFRTVRPATHIEKRARRAPHFHLGVYAPNRSTLYTQVYFEGEEFNDLDPILNSVSDPDQRKLLVVPLAPRAESEEFNARFDVVLRFYQED